MTKFYVTLPWGSREFTLPAERMFYLFGQMKLAGYRCFLGYPATHAIFLAGNEVPES